jgi:hypothetical protein
MVSVGGASWRGAAAAKAAKAARRKDMGCIVCSLDEGVCEIRFQMTWRLKFEGGEGGCLSVDRT